MPKRIVPLSDVQVRNAKPSSKPLKLFDGGGLFLLITPTGGKLWRFKYRFEGKEKSLSFGAYPEISLADARLKREDARRRLADDVETVCDQGAVFGKLPPEPVTERHEAARSQNEEDRDHPEDPDRLHPDIVDARGRPEELAVARKGLDLIVGEEVDAQEEQVEKERKGDDREVESPAPREDRPDPHAEKGCDDRQVGEVGGRLHVGGNVTDERKLEKEDQETVEAEAHGLG